MDHQGRDAGLVHDYHLLFFAGHLEADGFGGAAAQQVGS